MNFPSIVQILSKFEVKKVNGNEMTNFYKITVYLKHPVSIIEFCCRFEKMLRLNISILVPLKIHVDDL